MKDFISKVTFGFVMAQLVPGAIAVSSLLFLYVSLGVESPTSMLSVAHLAAARASEDILRQVALLGLFVGAGMLIHGVQWAVIGFLETRFKSVFNTYWHDLPIGAQILLGPVKIVREFVELLVRCRHVRDAGVDENVSKVAESRFPQFEFLQEFYLHFAQFYAHTAYALVIAVLSLVSFTAIHGLTWKRIGVCCGLYLASGLFFVIGRIQFQSMFRAEEALAEKPANSTATETAL